MAPTPPVPTQHAPPEHAEAPASRRAGARPLVYALVTAAAFIATVVVLALQAGTGTAMLTTVFVAVGALVVCGLWGTALAVRDSEAHLSSALARELLDHTPSRTH